jgi:hypothetical protein
MPLAILRSNWTKTALSKYGKRPSNNIKFVYSGRSRCIDSLPVGEWTEGVFGGTRVSERFVMSNGQWVFKAFCDEPRLHQTGTQPKQ